MGLDIEVTHVTDANEIISLDVMSTPELVIDVKVLSAGRASERNDKKNDE